MERVVDGSADAANHNPLQVRSAIELHDCCSAIEQIAEQQSKDVVPDRRPGEDPERRRANLQEGRIVLEFQELSQVDL
jgi:hypothetical protein